MVQCNSIFCSVLLNCSMGPQRSSNFSEAYGPTAVRPQVNICLVYLDDVIIFGCTFEEHLFHLKEVFEGFREAGLKLKLSKCSNKFIFWTTLFLLKVLALIQVKPMQL